eukprot:47504_1
MSKSAQCQTCDVSKPTCKATTSHCNYKIATTIFISKPRSNCTISSLETWAVMETKSISTHFSDTNNLKKIDTSNVQNCPTKPLPPLSSKSHLNTNHKLSPPLSVSCGIDDYLCRVSTNPYDRTAQSISQKKRTVNRESQFIFSTHSNHSYGTQSGFGGVTADELLQLISSGQCSSECGSEMDTQHSLIPPSPKVIVCTNDMPCQDTTTTVIPSILSISHQIALNDTSPTFSLSPSALYAPDGDTLVYNMTSYSIPDESSSDEDAQNDHDHESYKISRTLSA